MWWREKGKVCEEGVEERERGKDIEEGVRVREKDMI